MYSIIRGYGVPKGGNAWKYPFADMNIGDAFAVKDATRNRLSAAATKHAQKYGGKFTVRRTGNDNEYVVIRVA